MFKRLLILILCAFNISQRLKCRLNSRIHFSEPLPVILRNGRLLEPNDGDGNVDMDFGESLLLSCEGTGVIYHPFAVQQVPTGSIICDGADIFKNEAWLSSPSRFSLFKCSYSPPYSSQRSNRTCFQGYPIIEVGYRIQGTFYPVYETCFNEIMLNVVYSKYRQKPYNALYQTRVDRPFFIDNDNYGIVPVGTLFSPRGQKAAVAQLVGPLIDEYITGDEILSRGHLAAKTDFVFAFGERATFHYVNCAPQWTGLNGGNWNTLEVDLRNHIHAVGYDTIIYTGTFGVTQLLNQRRKRVDIYLYTDSYGNPVIPVPQYFYKVVYEPSSKRGIVFIGINNPYYTHYEAYGLFFCRDVCRSSSEFRWLSWHPDNPSEGYTFCCSVQDFRNTVPHLPDFEVVGLLT